jgi:hypothetical protein
MHARRALPVVLAGLVLAAPAPAQVVLTGGGTYTQNFDSLPSTGTAVPWAQNSTLPGWYAVRTGTGTDIDVGNGGSGFGNLYSFGSTGSTNRALGSIGASGETQGNYAWGVVFRNDGALPLTIGIQYAGEQWRTSPEGRQTANFTWRQSSTAITDADFSAIDADGASDLFAVVPALNFASPVFSNASIQALNGNLGPNRTAFNEDFTGLTGAQLDPGEHIAFRWWDQDHGGAGDLDHALAIDDLTITFTPVPVPEPGTVLAVAAAGLGLVGKIRRVRRNV